MRHLLVLVLGILLLLFLCIYFFEGAMIPAAWQLISVVWICVYVKFFLEDI
jgi:ABC-type multidrug transport system permease subunit